MKNEQIKTDYYKIASYIRSCNKEVQLSLCRNMIELFETKHSGQLELTFKWVDKFNLVNKLSNELKNYIKRQKANIKLGYVLQHKK